MAPAAAPGEAGSPLAATGILARALGSKTGCRSWSRAWASTRRRASERVISLSSSMSTAIRRAAGPVRFPERVWSMNSLFSSIVNSKSCTSR